MIRLLTTNDYQAYSQLRSLGLKTDPLSFWASEEEELPIRKERFDATLKHPFDFIIGCFEDGLLIAIAGFTREEKLKLNHKGFIWGVYTHPEHRGKGIAYKLLTQLINQAFEYKDLNQINLSTGAENFSAIKLYNKLGFIAYGTEPKSSYVNGQFHDEVYMVKFKN